MKNETHQCNCLNREKRIELENKMAELSLRIKRLDKAVFVLERFRLDDTSLGKTAKAKLRNLMVMRGVTYGTLHSHIKENK